MSHAREDTRRVLHQHLGGSLSPICASALRLYVLLTELAFVLGGHARAPPWHHCLSSAALRQIMRLELDFCPLAPAQLDSYTNDLALADDLNKNCFAQVEVCRSPTRAQLGSFHCLRFVSK